MFFNPVELEKIVEEAHKNKAYRPVVVSIILDRLNRVLVVQSAKDSNAWYFPQGGINENEDIIEALFREVHEELHIDRKVLVLRGYNGWIDVDAANDRTNRRGFTKGKRFFFFNLGYVGSPSLILNKDEISDYKWVHYENFDKAVESTREVKKRIMKDTLTKVMNNPDTQFQETTLISFTKEPL